MSKASGKYVNTYLNRNSYIIHYNLMLIVVKI